MPAFLRLEGCGEAGRTVGFSVCEDVLQDVFAHLEGFLAGGLAVVVHVGVFPAVAEVALPAEEAYQPPLPDEAVAAWGQVVVLMDFGQAVGEMVFLVVDGVGEGQFDKVELGEHLFHLRDDEVFEAVVVVDVEEAASDEVVAEVLRFLGVEDHVAVAGHVEEGVVEYLAAAHIDYGVVGGEVHLCVGVAVGYEVGE